MGYHAGFLIQISFFGIETFQLLSDAFGRGAETSLYLDLSVRYFCSVLLTGCIRQWHLPIRRESHVLSQLKPAHDLRKRNLDNPR